MQIAGIVNEVIFSKHFTEQADDSQFSDFLVKKNTVMMRYVRQIYICPGVYIYLFLHAMADGAVS